MKKILASIQILALSILLTLPSLTAAQSLRNPTSFSGIADFIAGFLRAITLVALPIVALFVVYAGFKYVSARGKPDKLTEANKNFVNVLIGAALILGAWVLATLIGGTITQLVRG